MNKLASWETLTGTRPSIESDRTIATVSFPLKSAIQLKTEDCDVPVNGNDAKNITQRQRNILDLIQQDSTISLDSVAKAIGVSAPTIDREIVTMAHISVLDQRKAAIGKLSKIIRHKNYSSKSLQLSEEHSIAEVAHDVAEFPTLSDVLTTLPFS